jgi:hypothetical protein
MAAWDVCTWRNAHRARRTDQPSYRGWRGIRGSFGWVASRRTCPTLGRSGVGGGRLASSGQGTRKPCSSAGVGLSLDALWMGGAWGIVRLGLAGVLAPVAHRATTCPHLATHPTGGAERGLIPMGFFQSESVWIGAPSCPGPANSSASIILLGVSGVILAVVGMIAVRRPPPPDRVEWLGRTC